MSATREVLLIDPSVADWQLIAANAGDAVRVVVLDGTQDGLAQIAAALAGEHGLAAVHIVSHGSAGQLRLGSTDIRAADLAQHAAALEQIGASLADGGDILLYGCDVARGAAGGVFLQQFARATGADVAASANATGAAALGGDWTLETRVGAVETAALAAKGYAGLLAIVNGNSWEDWLEGTIYDDTLHGLGGDDHLFSSPGNDVLDGGANDWRGDTADYANDPFGVTVDLAAGTAVDGWGGTDTLIGIEHVVGSPFGDSLTGAAGTNWFQPGAGDDVVNGDGDDAVMYEESNAAIDVDLRAGTASGSDIGTDTLVNIRNVHTGAGSDTIQLGDAGGYVFARGGDDDIHGGDGNDTLYGGDGADTYDGGAGNDTVSYDDDFTGKGVMVDLAGGIAIDPWNFVEHLSNIENATGTGTVDEITGDAGANRLNGLGGDDRLAGGAGDDEFTGGAGDDAIDGGAGNDRVVYWDEGTGFGITSEGVRIDLAAGTVIDNWGNTDTLTGVESASGSRFGDLINGDAGDNGLDGQDGDDTLTAGAGFDSLRGGAGADNLDGGAGQDTADYRNDGSAVAITGQGITVDLAAGTAVDNWGSTDTLANIEDVGGSRFGDVIAGNAADNGLHGNEGDDKLSAGDGNDYLDGGEGNDRLDGGNGSDTLFGGAGGDTLIGGAGTDGAEYWDEYGPPTTGKGVTVNLATGTALDNWNNTDTLSGIEDVRGSRYADLVTGDAGNNNLDGREGADTLAAGGGNDWLRGGDGADKIDGGAGRDRIDYRFDFGIKAASGSGVTVNLATGTALDNWGDTDTLSGIEDVSGSRYADTLTGDAGDNTLEGVEGDDKIAGGGGNDWLRGGDGADKIDGGAGNDTLIGGAGNDTLTGGADIDRVEYWDEEGAKAVNGAGVKVNLATGTALDNWGGTDTLSGIEDVMGSRFGDAIVGSAVRNNLDGQDGNDSINAGDGDDWLRGGAGNDTLTGASGRDRADYWNDYGNGASSERGVTVNLQTGKAVDNWGNTDTLSGIEEVTGSRFADALTGDAAGNNLDGQEGNDTLDGGAGDDWVGGGDDNDKLQGGAGYDTLNGGQGNDTLDGGADNDRVDYWNDDYLTPANRSGVKVDLAAGTATDKWNGTDTLANIEDVSGSRYADVIIGSAGNNNLSAHDGNDTIDGGAGDDFLTGGAGDDKIQGGAGDDRVDYHDDFGYAAALAAGVKVDLAAGTAVDNWGDTDTLAGIENVNGSRYADTIKGDSGHNSLEGREGNDVIAAGDGMDWLDGGSGVDNLQGGAGYDTLIGGAGNDTLNGGADADTADYWNDTDTSVPLTKLGVTVNLAAGTAVDNWGNKDTLVDIENVNGSRYGDTLTGNAGDNNLSGRDGNDTLVGNAGNDYLNGDAGDDSLQAGDGDDSLFGGAGVDTLNGGAGNDYVSYDKDAIGGQPGGKGVTVNLVTGTATDNWGNNDKLISIERIGGSRFADVITGNTADNSLQGNDGDDTIAGGDGDDWLDGGYGDDKLTGGNGNDQFMGSAGADILDGGTGANMVLYYVPFRWGDGTLPTTGKGVTIDLAAGTAIDNWGNKDKLINIQTVVGSEFGDTITGSAGDDNLNGDLGDDKLLGGAGSDNLSGGGGNDTLDGGAIKDLINYTDGNAIFYDGWNRKAGVSVNLATNRANDGEGGIDILVNINEVAGTEFDDTLTGSSRAVLEIFSGGKGDDVINGGAVTDRYNDTNGNRVVYLDAAKAVEVDLALGTATGGGGDDTLANITQVFGSAYADVLSGSDTDLVEQFYGGKGDDLIDGRGGLDQVRYAEAAAAVNVNLATGIARDGDGGTDELVDIEGVRGSRFNDTLVGGNTDNGVDADEGLEFFSGEAGNDIIDGGVGFDRADYTTSIAAVKVTLGGTGAGTAADGFGGTDTLRNIEAVRGSNFNDTLTGSDSGAFEAFEGRGGNDVIDGKGGIDLADYTTAGAAVNVNLGTGTATDGQGGTDKLSNIEWVRGSAAGNDVLTGNALANRLEGLGGNDTLNGGAGADTLVGGDGNDTYYVDNAGDVVLETSARKAGGIDRVSTTISYKLGANVENLTLQGGDINGTGNALDNVIYAGSGRNAIDGDAGIDTLSYEFAEAASGTAGVTLLLGGANVTTAAVGISGADTVRNIENVHGSKYNDILTGNTGANTLVGNAGIDTLNGGAGKDVLTGGAGADLFVFNTALGSTNVDTITDFKTEDTIRLENAVFKALAATGTLSASYFKVGKAADANDFILYDKATGALSYDADGSGTGAAVQFALVGVNLALTNADFVVI